MLALITIYKLSSDIVHNSLGN